MIKVSKQDQHNATGPRILVLDYLDNLKSIVATAKVTGEYAATLEDGLQQFIERAVHANHNGHKVIFIGNGGSAGICSHMATDYSKNGGIRSLAFNDGAVLTCLSNDYGFEHVFAKQIEWHANAGDIVVAISSSGRSINILNAAAVAKEVGCTLVTLSGFRADNPLRGMGHINFYLDTSEYGFVEVGHLTLLHAALDLRTQFNETNAQ
ncbi:MAG: SIS domain-containing protein [Myxococcota bacterium]